MTKPFELRTNASDYAIGGVLFQKNEQRKKQLVWYGSRVLFATEQRYGAPEKDL